MRATMMRAPRGCAASLQVAERTLDPILMIFRSGNAAIAQAGMTGIASKQSRMVIAAEWWQDPSEEDLADYKETITSITRPAGMPDPELAVCRGIAAGERAISSWLTKGKF